MYKNSKTTIEQFDINAYVIVIFGTSIWCIVYDVFDFKYYN